MIKLYFSSKEKELLWLLEQAQLTNGVRMYVSRKIKGRTTKVRKGATKGWHKVINLPAN